MPVSKAQQAATNKYISKNYDRINLTVPKGQKEIVKSHAETHGESVNAFINRAISETMERDGEACGWQCIQMSPVRNQLNTLLDGMEENDLCILLTFLGRFRQPDPDDIPIPEDLEAHRQTMEEHARTQKNAENPVKIL